VNKEIILITDSKNKIPQKAHETESLDINELYNQLSELGYSVNVTNYFNIINFYKKEDIKNNIFFYASSQYLIYKNYINDCLLYIMENGGILLPNYSIFNAHENKVYQELEKKRIDIMAPKSYIIGTIEEAKKTLNEIEYPFIAKVSSGFGSRGVQKVRNKREGKSFIKKNMKSLDGSSIFEKGTHLYRKIKFRKCYPQKTGKIIFQEMLKNLDCDWKVLVFYDRIYTLKRYTRKNDFRASGSGLFDFDAVPSNKVLDFAIDISQKLKTPLLSLDIVEKNDKTYLIEYQGLHYGLITAIDNKSYYQKSNENIWTEKNNTLTVEENFVYAINHYILNYNEVL